MSDKTKAEKVGAWNQEAQYNFLLHIVSQFYDGKGAVNWGNVKIPGRTTKSLQNQWTKVRKQLEEIKATKEAGAGEDENSPVKQPRSRKPRQKKGQESEGDDDEAEEEKLPVVKKRAAANGTGGGRKKPKKEEDSSDDKEGVKDEDLT